MTAAPYPTVDEYRNAVTNLTAAAAAYYQGTGLLMADADYDHSVERVTATETARPDWTVEHTLVGTVAAGVGAGDIPHTTPMLSLDKAHDHPAVTAWWGRLQTVTGSDTPPVVVEPKLDGIAAAAHYRHGHLTQVLTRGDGRTGEDVTSRIPTQTDGLPRIINHSEPVEVRGELVFTDTQFDVANQARIGEGKPGFVNARNALAGTIRREDLTADQRPAVTFHAYTVHSPASHDSHTDDMTWLTGLGFQPAGALTTTTSSGPLTTVDQVLAAIDQLGRQRHTLGRDIDGAVIKADQAGHRRRAGETSSHPRWAIAYKYEAEETTTQIEDIELAVGRTGRISVRYRLTPVFIGGTTITYATGHHPGMVTQMGIHIGATVMVRRAGDVIPYVTGVTQPAANAQPWNPPETCPECANPVNKDTRVWRCENRDCTAGAGALLIYAASRDALDIDGCGEQTVTVLMEAGLVGNLADLYRVTADQIAGLDGFGETSARNLVDGIARARTQPLHRLITALGIRMTGRRISRRLATHFGTLHALRAATAGDLQQVEGIGAKRAEVIRTELDHLGPLLDDLETLGLNTVDENYGTDNPAASGRLDGITVVVTGSMAGTRLAGLSRTAMNDLVEQHGGRAGSNVSRATGMVVAAGDAAGSSKHRKAVTLGVRIVTPDEFADLIGIT